MNRVQAFVLLSVALACVRPPVAHGAVGNLLGKLPFSDTGSDSFGNSVAINGNTVIVGSPDFSAGINGSQNEGRAFVYDASSGNLLRQLVPSTLSFQGRFGLRVALHDNTALVGAPGEFVVANSSGAAYLFDVTSGSQLSKLVPNDSAFGDGFGQAVALNSTTAIIGSTTDNGAGQAYLFDTTTGIQLAKLLPNDAFPGKHFGVSTAVDGNIAIIGADGESADAGTAYLFNVATRTQLAKLLPTDIQSGQDKFGYSVAISGNFAIVGVPNDDDKGLQSGSAYIFNATTGQQIAKLLASDGAAGDGFGFSVGINGNTIIVGASGDDDKGTDSGSAYLFDLITHQQLARLLPSDLKSSDRFGTSVALRGSIAVAGAPHPLSINNAGAAYRFDATNSVPEPSTLMGLLFCGSAGLLFSRRQCSRLY